MPSPPVEMPTPAGGECAALARGIGLVQATSLNVANMVGVGPFITIPLFVASMGGPQALVGWIVGRGARACATAWCGASWARRCPAAAAPITFCARSTAAIRGGRLIAFLFIWQFLISGTLELASGYIGGSDYLAYALPGLAKTTLAELGQSRAV